jgi:phage repressor protein C with HTH and peptisase S24 domain
MANAPQSDWGMLLPQSMAHVNPNSVRIERIHGDSMETTLCDGDYVFLNLDDTDVSQGGIFGLIDNVGSDHQAGRTGS